MDKQHIEKMLEDEHTETPPISPIPKVDDTLEQLSFPGTVRPTNDVVRFARSNRYLASVEAEFRGNIADVKQRLGI